MDGTGSDSCTLASCGISGGVLFGFLLPKVVLVIFIFLDIKLPLHKLDAFQEYAVT
jgi:hypothetical protein